MEGKQDDRLYTVRKTRLLEQADAEHDEAAQDQMWIWPLGSGGLELRDDIPMVQDRPRNQVREIGHEQRVMRQGVVANLAAISIDQKGDLGESVKRNPDRKQDVHREGRRKY